MSGHNKWSKIKHKKAATDASRSKVWTKIIREITVAARAGGGDLGGNARLRIAVDKGRGANMPNDTIDRAIKKGSGELGGVTYDEVLYEGYGPGGVAVIVEATTDNRNRTVSEVRHVFERFGGNMGASGSVAWIFKRRGLIYVLKDGVGEDRIMELALDAGAEDVKDAGESWEVDTDASTYGPVKDAVAKAGLKVTHSEIAMVPATRVHLDEHKAATMLKLMNALEDDDDVLERLTA